MNRSEKLDMNSGEKLEMNRSAKVHRFCYLFSLTEIFSQSLFCRISYSVL